MIIDENIFVQIPTYIFWKDLNLKYRGCNTDFAHVAGINCVNQVIDKTDYDLIWGDTHADLYRLGDLSVLDGIKQESIIEPQYRADKTVNILITKRTLLDKNKQIIGVIGSYTEHRDVNYHSRYDVSNHNIPLSKQQAECLYYLAKGMTSKQIANEMDLSYRTVEHYVSDIKCKLKCRTRSELIDKALSINFIKYRLINNG